MKAIRIHKYGGPEVLEYEQAPRPQPQAGEILIRVHAAGVNPIDWKVRAGYIKDFIPHKFPLILGWDVSGAVEEIGPGVLHFKKGDEVCGKLDLTRDGAYAEYALARESEIALKPKSLHHVHAAAVPSDQFAEIATLTETGKLKPIIDRILPLSEARRAHELSQSAHVRGKIVLRVKEEQP